MRCAPTSIISRTVWASRLVPPKNLASAADPDDPRLGLRKVVGLMDAGRSLAEFGLLDETVELLEQHLQRPLNRLPGAREVASRAATGAASQFEPSTVG